MNLLVMLTGIDLKINMKTRKVERFKIVDATKAAIFVEFFQNLLNLDSLQTLKLKGEIGG